MLSSTRLEASNGVESEMAGAAYTGLGSACWRIFSNMKPVTCFSLVSGLGLHGLVLVW